MLTGSDDEARALVGQLKSEGHLSATNILFLEVRRLAASRHWDAIMAMPELDALVSMPRPKRVTEAILQAVYETRLREYQVSGRADDAVARFPNRGLPKVSTFISVACNASGNSRGRQFYLGSWAADPPRPDLAAEVLEGYPPDSPDRESWRPWESSFRPSSGY